MVIELFDQYASKYDDWFRSEQGRALFPAELQAIQLLLNQLIPRHQQASFLSLEIGVGTGAFAEALEILFGIDPAFGALELAKKRGVKVAQARGETLPFRQGTFSCVLLITTLCFLENPIKVLKEAARVLKPDGGLIVSDIEPNSLWGQFYLEKKRAGHLFYRHARFYSKNEIESMLQQVSLEVVGYSSAITQPPNETPTAEGAFEGIVPNASFVCLLSKKAICETWS
ncbi:class I SAM-dependent methyltransferase [Candidatus Poribacteria bacterium]|nr:class I SAM-dependent methyltransferase [Candidatus Poribacteria bacterium]